MKNKFNIGDKVEVIKYGHPIWENINGKLIAHDINPEIIGKTGVISKVIETQGNIQYTIEGIPQKYAWYDEQQLKKCNMNVIEQMKLTEEKQQNDADLLIEKMFLFMPVDTKNSERAIISAKFCAKVACNYLIEKLPSINNTPPIHRKDEEDYQQYWMGVKIELDKFKA